MKIKFLFYFLFFTGLSLPIFTHAANIRTSEIKILNIDGATISSFNGLPQNNFGGLSVAAGDLGMDGMTEIITGAGFNTDPQIKIFRQDGSLITSFLAYDQRFNKGVNVTVGDVDGDGLKEIITGPGFGGGPHVRIFDGFGNLKAQFFAYDQNFRGGVSVTSRDIDTDGRDEIITGAGPTGGPHVKVFDQNGNIKFEFFAFETNDQSGVTVGTANIDVDRRPEILVGRASSDPPEIKIFSNQGQYLRTLIPFETNFTGGLSAQGLDVNGDNLEEIIVAPNGRSPLIKIIDQYGNLIRTITPFENDFSGAIKLTTATLNSEGTKSIIVAPSRPIREGNIEHPKSIIVSLREQRLYAFERGLLVESVLVSTGIARFPTPIGEFRIQRKVPIKDYVWSYGKNNPNNYALRDVKWNLQFRPGYYLHYAYWHNDFGRPRSHGCVNMDRRSSEWIYGWAEVGTPVTIQN